MDDARLARLDLVIMAKDRRVVIQGHLVAADENTRALEHVRLRIYDDLNHQGNTT
jgi:hypothetical protein